MTLKIQPVYANNHLQNYIWFIINQQNNQAIVVDPTSAELTQQFLQENSLELTQIWITHDHNDHVAGVVSLKQNHPNAEIVGHAQHQLSKGISVDKAVDEASIFHAWGREVLVWSLEGHKRYHLGYLLSDEPDKAIKQQHVFSGDILFSAGCGRNFEGSIDELYDSLQRLASLPDDTLFYPTHEFTINNLNFAKSILPEDEATLDALKQASAIREQGKPTLPVTLAHEKRVNLFLRVNETTVIERVASQIALQDNNPRTVFKALRRLKDRF